MASNISPHRESLLVWKEKTAKDEQRYHCDYCQIDMEKITTCPDCRNKLSLIQACGVTNYFCFLL
ncbi:YfgJ family double zinc ribbon protein [Vibrio casei]|uniref:YfgJ family double zinc ribbon protein n=1 Tax=Vibrio casei TaxID=673372 RepID=UPI0026AE5E20|nr:zinc-ribbon domain-containing protein [Vibrio casei]